MDKDNFTKYSCSECNFVCTEDKMEANYVYLGTDEIWSNWICPKCGYYHIAPDEKDSGWHKINSNIECQQ